MQMVKTKKGKGGRQQHNMKSQALLFSPPALIPLPWNNYINSKCPVYSYRKKKERKNRDTLAV